MILAANWKMNKGPDEAKDFLLQMKKEIPKEDQKKIIFFVPALHFGILSPIFAETSFGWGGQNCWISNEGAFTGENSPQVMKQMGAGYCLAGHSERRSHFLEDNALIKKKLAAILHASMTPVLCVGETAQQKQMGKQKQVLQKQLAMIPDPTKIILAYEPVWAVGSGLRADNQWIANTVQMIQNFFKNLPKPLSKPPVILYGGSVSSEEMPTAPGLSGLLAGSQSLNPASFLALYKQIKKSQNQ